MEYKRKRKRSIPFRDAPFLWIISLPLVAHPLRVERLRGGIMKHPGHHQTGLCIESSHHQTGLYVKGSHPQRFPAPVGEGLGVGSVM